MCAKARVTQSSRDKTPNVDVSVVSVETLTTESAVTLESTAVTTESVRACNGSVVSAVSVESGPAHAERGVIANVRRMAKRQTRTSRYVR